VLFCIACRLWSQARSVRTVSVKERDALMNELHSLAGTFRSRHDKLHEQASAALLCCWAQPCGFGIPCCWLLLDGF
jgi:hypothetical protein